MAEAPKPAPAPAHAPAPKADPKLEADPTLAPNQQYASVAESAVAMRDYVYRTKVRLSKGAKSDIDKIVPVLEYVIAWIDLILANATEPPPPTREVLDRF